jgi:hypothetical protein
MAKRVIAVAQLVEQSGDDPKFEGLNTTAADSGNKNGKKLYYWKTAAFAQFGKRSCPVR